jgi:hypothetical protein
MGRSAFQQDPDRLPPEYVRDQNWLDAHLSDLVDQHPDKWVAVLDEQVIEVGDDLDQVMTKAEARFPDSMPVYWLVEGTPRVYASGASLS